MNIEAQKHAPVYEALERLRKKRVVPFDVPGHKRGRGNPELKELLGEKCVSLDVNSMKPLDNLCHPMSVIKEAEELAAEAFGADRIFYGGGNYFFRAEHGDDGLPGGAEDYPAPERTQKRDKCPGVKRGGSGVCKS